MLRGLFSRIRPSRRAASLAVRSALAELGPGPSRQKIETLAAAMRRLEDALFAKGEVARRAEAAHARALTALQQDLAALKTELATLRADVEDQRPELAGLRGEVATLGGSLAGLAERQAGAERASARLEAEHGRHARDASTWQRELLSLAWEAHTRAVPTAAPSLDPPDELGRADVLERLAPSERTAAEQAGRLGAFLEDCAAVLALDAAAPLEQLRSRAEQSCDALAASGLAERLADAELAAVLAEAHRVLRPGGRLVLELWRSDSLAALRELRAGGALPRRLLSPARARALLLAAGFHRVEVDAPPTAEAGPAVDAAPRYVVAARRPGRPAAAPVASEGRRANGTGIAPP